ncbi:ParA family protein, partial [Klebsiella variicola]
LLADFDPQANATDIYFKTAINAGETEKSFNETLLKAIENKDLKRAILNLGDNIDFLPSSADFSLLPRMMEKQFPDSYLERVTYISKLLKPLDEQYDFIL